MSAPSHAAPPIGEARGKAAACKMKTKEESSQPGKIDLGQAGCQVITVRSSRATHHGERNPLCPTWIARSALLPSRRPGSTRAELPGKPHQTAGLWLWLAAGSAQLWSEVMYPVGPAGTAHKSSTCFRTSIRMIHAKPDLEFHASTASLVELGAKRSLRGCSTLKDDSTNCRILVPRTAGNPTAVAVRILRAFEPAASERI